MHCMNEIAHVHTQHSKQEQQQQEVNGRTTNKTTDRPNRAPKLGDVKTKYSPGPGSAAAAAAADVAA